MSTSVAANSASTAEEAVRRSQEEAEIDYGSALYEWDVVIEQSRMAPPDARFPFRIRQIAQAAALRATTVRAAIHDAAFEWQPVPGSAAMTLSDELRRMVLSTRRVLTLPSSSPLGAAIPRDCMASIGRCY